MSEANITAAEEAALEPYLGGRTFDERWAEYDREGFVIFPGMMPESELDRQRAALDPWLDKNITGRNNFEGVASNRIYAMLGKDPVFADLITHPLQLAFAKRELGNSFLLSACLAINLHPGETVQPWHQDDGHCLQKMPRDAFGVSTFWTIDAVTEDNGATEILPGSHKWGEVDINGVNSEANFSDRLFGKQADDTGFDSYVVKALMPAGSLMIAKGNIWHRGGANESGETRLIVTPQYCPGWMRPLETMLLAVPPEKAAKLPERVQELLGYSIHPPFMGYMDGMHPARVLG